ncbi:MAG: hypothetical protein Q7T61_09220 [Caulobacter sp.]|nr:hypothetical protein [Caulobacter sp.]
MAPWGNGLALVAALAAGGALAAEGPRLRPTQLGAFAMFTDLDSIARTGVIAKFRVLQVAETGFTAGGVAYVGGWRWFEVDCSARTARGLGFASVRADGVEGPVTGGGGELAAIAPGGIEDEAAKVVCDGASPLGAADVAGVDAAVAAGRRWIPTGEID